MRPFKDYDKTQAFAEYERLPKGGYVSENTLVKIIETVRK